MLGFAASFGVGRGWAKNAGIAAAVTFGSASFLLAVSQQAGECTPVWFLIGASACSAPAAEQPGETSEGRAAVGASGCSATAVPAGERFPGLSRPRLRLTRRPAPPTQALVAR